MSLQHKMIIQKSKQMSWFKRVHSRLVTTLAWSTWLFLIGSFFDRSNTIFTKNIVQHWQITDVAIGILALCVIQLCVVHFWAWHKHR